MEKDIFWNKTFHMLLKIKKQNVQVKKTISPFKELKNNAFNKQFFTRKSLLADCSKIYTFF